MSESDQDFCPDGKCHDHWQFADVLVNATTSRVVDGWEIELCADCAFHRDCDAMAYVDSVPE